MALIDFKAYQELINKTLNLVQKTDGSIVITRDLDMVFLRK